MQIIYLCETEFECPRKAHVHTKFLKILAREFKWETHKQTKHTHCLMISKTCFVLFRMGCRQRNRQEFLFSLCACLCAYILCIFVSGNNSHYDPHRSVPAVKILTCVSLYWFITKSKTFKDNRTITALLTVLVPLVMKTK
jgi:hypothetical protein